MRASAVVKPAKLIIVINNKKVNIEISSSDFSEVITGDYKINKETNSVKILVRSGTVKLDWIKFE